MAEKKKLKEWRICITGASGLLGRALMESFSDLNVLPLAFSRSGLFFLFCFLFLFLFLFLFYLSFLFFFLFFFYSRSWLNEDFKTVNNRIFILLSSG